MSLEDKPQPASIFETCHSLENYTATYRPELDCLCLGTADISISYRSRHLTPPHTSSHPIPFVTLPHPLHHLISPHQKSPPLSSTLYKGKTATIKQVPALTDSRPGCVCFGLQQSPSHSALERLGWPCQQRAGICGSLCPRTILTNVEQSLLLL